MPGRALGLGSIAVFLLFIGCAAQPVAVTEVEAPKREAPRVAPAVNEEYWWYVRFRPQWPEQEDPAWHLDLLLADRVVGPVLDAERDAISLWRFHRRAARDAAGHQFSFIFRTSPSTAARINAKIAADPLLARLQRARTLTSVGYDDPAKPRRPGIGDTSDKHWSPEMQVAWPYFIMGVSRLWLELIREIGNEEEWPEAPDARYAAINEALNALWRDQGNHALLHHLSAVFGYREVQVIRRQLIRF